MQKEGRNAERRTGSRARGRAWLDLEAAFRFTSSYVGVRPSSLEMHIYTDLIAYTTALRHYGVRVRRIYRIMNIH